MTEKATKNIYLFYGEDTYSSSQKLNFWTKEFIKKHGEESLEVLEGKKLDLPNFLTNIESIPLFSEKRLIVIKNFLSDTKAEAQKRVSDSLENAQDNCILVFHENEMPDKRLSLFKKISKIGKIEYFKALTPGDLSKWILDRAKMENIKISFITANYLTLHCGLNLWTISNEFEKLKLYAQEKEITKEMIEELCSPSLSASIFKLTDSIAQKNARDSLKTFEILKDSGEDLIKVFFMIVRHFRILIQVKELILKKETVAEVIRKLKQHPFVIQKTTLQSQNFSQEKLEEIYRKLLEIDIKTKTGIIKIFAANNKEFALAIEQLIIDCCQKKEVLKSSPSQIPTTRHQQVPFPTHP